MHRYPFIQFRLFICFLFFVQCAGLCQTQTLSSSFKIKHTSNARFFESRKYIHTRDNATVIVGKWGATEDGADLLVMKVGARGEQVWAKKIAVGIRLDEYELTEMSDGSLVFVGDSQYNTAPTNSDMLLIKFTCQGDVVWSRNLSMAASVPHRFLTPYSIKEGKNNDAIISFYGVNSGVQYTVVCRVNGSGNMVWSKTFYGADTQTQLPSVAFFANDKIVVFGFKSLYQNSFLYNKSLFAMQLDYNTGATLTLKGYDYSEFITNYGVVVSHPKTHFYAEQLTNGGFALFGMFSNFNQQNGYYYKLLLRPDLSIDKAAAFSVPAENVRYWSKISVFPNGQTHVVCANYDSQRFYWYAADSLQNKIREQKTIYPNTYIDLRYAVSQSGPGRSLCVLSTMNTTAAANGSIEVIQAEDNDARMLPCLGVDTSFVTVKPWSVFSGTMQWQSVTDNEAVLSALQFTSTPVPAVSQYACEPLSLPPSADPASIKIGGKDTVCFSGAVQQYFARRTNQPAPVVWFLDSTRLGTLTTLNDSTVSVAFNQPAQPTRVKLYAYAGTCTVSQDSLTITLLPPNLKLSASVNTCNPPFTLHPGWWFKDYLWQDGSTDSTFVVTQPGLYFVTLSDGCGNVIKDSITVTDATISIGPDRSKCNNDTLHLNAPPGFLTYTWSPAYNISSTTGASVVVNPSVDTAYVVKAGKGPGCFAYDTVRITVRKSPPIALGPDAGFCSGDSLRLDAGTGFSSYLWNTGATGQLLTVRAKGRYSVIGSTPEGCQSFDTLQVLQVFPLPQVQLDKNTSLCEGETRTLDAGSFASYLWQDNSTARTFAAATTGPYYVQVTDNNNCKGSDTALIATIYPSPKNFLPADTSFCPGEKLELKPASGYRSYWWSTGASTPSLAISQPAIYWLRVQDDNGCSGSDSLLVSVRNCIAGFFVPTGFTPNGDGKNDDFHPVLTGAVKNYLFTIYNRWGQVVFQTTDLRKGWNGKLGDMAQATGLFVWTCAYQFEGEETKTAKGTVILIK